MLEIALFFLSVQHDISSLQNDLKELWSLLNLPLPEVFDNRKVFHDWFSKPFQKEGPPQNAEDDRLETEKKFIIIHRLHQILEPLMLRRRVEDVEGSLPPKVWDDHKWVLLNNVQIVLWWPLIGSTFGCRCPQS